MRSPAPNHRHLGVIDSLDTHVDVFPHSRRVRLADDLPLAGLVGESVADSDLHRYTRVVLDTFACGPGKGNCSASFGSRSFLGRGLDISAVGSGTLEPVVPS